MKTVLVADDNEISRELIKEVLSSEGCRIVEAEDGLEVLARIGEVQPDIVLLDIQMPGLDGFGVLQAVRRDARFLRTPVVALTASAMKDDRERALSAGFDEYLTKPIRAAALRSRLRALLQRSGRVPDEPMATSEDEDPSG
jgi:CheY-like chemotaxis protein